MKNKNATIPMKNLPSQGRPYPEGTEVGIRAATAAEIRHFSTIKNWRDKYDTINVSEYVPDPVAKRLGYVCPMCDGMRINPLYGEKVCSCNRDEEAVAWQTERMRRALAIASTIGYDAAFVCESCSKLNKAYGNTVGGGNVCEYCGHTTSPIENFEWVCNECNFPNLTSSVSEVEIEQELHACVNCGCFEMHKRYK